MPLAHLLCRLSEECTAALQVRVSSACERRRIPRQRGITDGRNREGSGLAAAVSARRCGLSQGAAPACQIPANGRGAQRRGLGSRVLPPETPDRRGTASTMVTEGGESREGGMAQTFRRW
jgi:hypothetical protein